MRLKTIFYNSDEQRLRMFWRVLFQTGVFAIFSIPIGLILMGIYSSSVGGEAASPITREAITAFITSHPSMMLLNSFLSLLAVMGSFLIAIKYFDKRPWQQFGLNFGTHWWSDMLFGLGVGAILMAGIFVVELMLGWIEITDTFYVASGRPFALAIIFPLVNFILVGFYEELLSRGYQLTNFAQGFRFLGSHKISVIVGLFLSSLIFGVGHALNPDASVVGVVNIVLVAIVFLGFAYIITGSLAISIGAHISWNFFQGHVFGFPVSGAKINSVTVFAIEQRGNSLMTGGEFGPEGGLIGIMAELVGMVLIAAWVKQQRGELRIHTDIAEPGKIQADEKEIL